MGWYFSGHTGELDVASPQTSESTGSTESQGRKYFQCFWCRSGRTPNDSSEADASCISVADFVIDALHGVSQVCFFTNSVAGVVFLVAVLFGTPRQAVILGLLGVLVATATSWCFSLDSAARKDGTLGYNAMLVGCAFAFAVPYWWSVLATLALASLSTFVAAGLLKIVSPQLTLAFNFSALSTLAVIHLIDHGTATPAAITWNNILPQLSTMDCVTAILNGVSQIFFVASPISGCLILFGIGFAGPFMTFSTLLGSTVATLGAARCGADISRFQQGIWGYNAALTALWISFHFRSLGYVAVFFLVCFGAAAATAVFAGMDAVVAMTHGFAPTCFTLPFNAVGLSLVAIQRFIQGIHSLTKAKSSECMEQC